jgi:hypothetical protein
MAQFLECVRDRSLAESVFNNNESCRLISRLIRQRSNLLDLVQLTSSVTLRSTTSVFITRHSDCGTPSMRPAHPEACCPQPIFAMRSLRMDPNCHSEIMLCCEIAFLFFRMNNRRSARAHLDQLSLCALLSPKSRIHHSNPYLDSAVRNLQVNRCGWVAASLKGRPFI